MKMPAAILAGLALTACTPTSTGAPAASASPTAAPAASRAPAPAGPSGAPSPAASTAPMLSTGAFVPTKLTLAIDGAPVELSQVGFLQVVDPKILSFSLGTTVSEKAGERTLVAFGVQIMTKGKAIDAPDFTKADAALVVLGMSWAKELTVRNYATDPAGALTLANAGGKLALSYKGKMTRGAGSGTFPESIEVDFAAEGIPTKK